MRITQGKAKFSRVDCPAFAQDNGGAEKALQLVLNTVSDVPQLSMRSAECVKAEIHVFIVSFDSLTASSRKTMKVSVFCYCDFTPANANWYVPSYTPQTFSNNELTSSFFSMAYNNSTPMDVVPSLSQSSTTSVDTITEQQLLEEPQRSAVSNNSHLVERIQATRRGEPRPGTSRQHMVKEATRKSPRHE